MVFLLQFLCFHIWNIVGEIGSSILFISSVCAKMTVLKSGLIYVLGFCIFIIFLFSVFVYSCISFKFQIWHPLLGYMCHILYLIRRAPQPAVTGVISNKKLQILPKGEKATHSHLPTQESGQNMNLGNLMNVVNGKGGLKLRGGIGKQDDVSGITSNKRINVLLYKLDYEQLYFFPVQHNKKCFSSKFYTF